MIPAAPRTDQPHYGAHLGNPDYWGPYVGAALARAGLPAGPVEPGVVGTFRTFLAGEVVVKLFGDAFDGAGTYRAELAMHQLLVDHLDIPAPGLVATGELYSDGPGWPWPYLITRRLRGRPLRQLSLPQLALTRAAGRLGEIVARLHELPAPAPVAGRNLLPALRQQAADRALRHGLPAHLAEQVPNYLDRADVGSILVHADITADHVFLDGTDLVGLIDWGDAMVADRYYEFVPVYLNALDTSLHGFSAFLAGYGLHPAAWSSTKALQGVLEFQFDAIGRIRDIVDLDRVRSLDELAERLFGDVGAT